MSYVRVIDADGHVDVRHPDGGLDDVLSKNSKEAVNQFLRQQSQRFRDLPGPGSNVNEARPGQWNPHLRIQDMATEGIESAVLVVGGNGEEWAGRDANLAATVCAAYNDWLRKYCSSYGSRLKGLIKLPLIDVEASILELDRIGHDPYAAGVQLTQHVLNQNLDDPAFDPIYARAQDLDLPVCVHGGGQAADQVPVGVDRFDSRLMVHAFTHPVGAMIAMMTIAVGGVMEKFPKLRFSYLEAGCGWIPTWIERLDEHYELLSQQAPNLKSRPSEYLLNGSTFFACETNEVMLPAVIEAMGDEHIVYASDYCHWDCNFPDTVSALTSRNDVAEESKANILGKNALRLYSRAF